MKCCSSQPLSRFDLIIIGSCSAGFVNIKSQLVANPSLGPVYNVESSCCFYKLSHILYITMDKYTLFMITFTYKPTTAKRQNQFSLVSFATDVCFVAKDKRKSKI